MTPTPTVTLLRRLAGSQRFLPIRQVRSRDCPRPYPNCDLNEAIWSTTIRPRCNGDVRRSHRRSARTDHLGTSRQPPGCSSCDPVVEVVTATARAALAATRGRRPSSLEASGLRLRRLQLGALASIRCRASSTSSLKAAAPPGPTCRRSQRRSLNSERIEPRRELDVDDAAPAAFYSPHLAAAKPE